MKNLKDKINDILSQHQFNNRQLYWLSQSSIITPGDDSQFQQITLTTNFPESWDLPSDSPFHQIEKDLTKELLTFNPTIITLKPHHPDYQYNQIILTDLISQWESTTGNSFRIQITDHTIYIIQIESSL